MNTSLSVTHSVDIESLISLNETDVEELFEKVLNSILEDKTFVASCLYKDLFDGSYEELEIDLYLCDNPEIKEINNKFRNIDAPTDVLSFAMLEDSNTVKLPVVHLGEIIISVDKLIEQARENNHSALHELVFLLSHGLLHLFGFNHDTDEDYNTIIEIQKRIVISCAS
jgi:probable rRNA maturation factor